MNATVQAHTYSLQINPHAATHRAHRTQKGRERESGLGRNAACDFEELVLSRGTLEQKIAVPHHPS